MNKRCGQPASSMTTTIRLLGRLLLLQLLCGTISAQQQLFLARIPRSVYGPPSFQGWNTVSSFSPPVSFGHMTKDELLTLLEAWQEVEEETATPAPEPAETPAPPTRRPVRPRPRPPPRPTPRPTEPAPPPAPELPPPGAPVTVQLPAFVPIQLQAMFTPPAANGGGAVAGGGGIAFNGGGAAAIGGGAAGNGGGGAVIFNGAGGGAGAGAGGAGAGARIGLGFDQDFADLDLIGQSNEEASPRLFRYMQFPMHTGAQPRPRHANAHAQPHVTRNTLESVDSGIAPLSNFVNIKSKNTNFRPPMSLPQQQHPAASQMPVIRPKFVVPPPPPFLANAPGPLELVPSSQIFGNWRE